MLALSLSDKFCCFGIFVFVNENHIELHTFLVSSFAVIVWTQTTTLAHGHDARENTLLRRFAGARDS